MTKAVNPWELIHDKTISQLVFSYEMVLTEMRTHAKANRTIKEWVARLDFDRDEFVKSMLVKPDEPTASIAGMPFIIIPDPDMPPGQIELRSSNGQRVRVVNIAPDGNGEVPTVVAKQCTCIRSTHDNRDCPLHGERAYK